VRGDHDAVVVEQRALGARLDPEHVQPGARDTAVLEGQVKGLLVHDAAAGGVDDAHRRLHQPQLAVADEAERLGRLGQVDGDEVALAQQLLQAHQPDAELRGAGGLDVRVVGDDVHVERRQPLGDEHADAAETEHADGLALQLDAGVLGALPLALLEGRVPLRNVPSGGQKQRDRVLGGGDDVGGGGVDHHHPGLGGGLHVDVVESHARPGHHPQPVRVLEHLGGDLGRTPHDQRVDVGDGRQQPLPVGPVDVPDLEVGLQLGDAGRGEFFCDEDDRLAQGRSF
jgi:hypothetical protein